MDNDTLTNARLKALDLWIEDYRSVHNAIDQIIAIYNSGPHIGKNPRDLNQSELKHLFETNQKIQQLVLIRNDIKARIANMVKDPSYDPVFEKLAED